MTDVASTAPAAPPPPNGNGRRRRHRGGFVWPLVLIVVGGVFLLNNLGLLGPFSIASLLRLWPLILVMVGVDLLFARRWPLVALALDLALVVLAVAVASGQVGRGPEFPPFFVDGRARGAGQASVSLARDPGVQSLGVRVSGGGGRYRLSGGSDVLLDATSDRSDLVLRSSRAGTRLDASLQQADVPFGGAPANVNVRVATDVPVSLRFDAGAGDFTVDLRDVSVTDVRMSMGASSVLVVLPKPSGDVPVRIDSGATSITVEVPDGVEARVTTTGGLISLHSANPRVVEQGGAIAETAGYPSAHDRVTVSVNAGATSVTVR